jgi:hypothetical protein
MPLWAVLRRIDLDVAAFSTGNNGWKGKIVMAENYRKVRVFVASPSDVAGERAKVETVNTLLKRLADHVGVHLEVVDWRHVVPNMGRPQQVIFDQLQPTTWDVFIGILWHRFGTPPGAINPIIQQEYQAGTEEEFVTAYRLWEEFKKPRIIMYRCTRSVSLDVLDPDQYKRVKDFFAQFDATHGTHPGLYQTFDTTERFEQLLADNLQELLLEYSEKERRRRVSRQTMKKIVPSRYPDNLPRRAQFFGRDKEMKEVLRALSPDDRGWGVVIDGIGGIGKTALAIEVAHCCKQRGMFDGFIFVSAKKKCLEPTGITAQLPAAATLDEFIDVTARELRHTDILRLTGETKRRALIEVLRPTRTLLIYDNLETLMKRERETMPDLLRQLPDGCKAIATSRQRGGQGAHWVRLGQLDWDAARDLIEHESEREAGLAATMQSVGQERWRELYDETGGSPLAIIWTLGLMRVRSMPFEQALAMLRSDDARRSPLHVLHEFIYKQARQNLSVHATSALHALSFFSPSASFEALMAVSDLTRTVLETVLAQLSALSLVNVPRGTERYALHPLTRNYILIELKAIPQEERTMKTRFDEYYRALEVRNERGE